MIAWALKNKKTNELVLSFTTRQQARDNRLSGEKVVRVQIVEIITTK